MEIKFTHKKFRLKIYKKVLESFISTTKSNYSICGAIAWVLIGMYPEVTFNYFYDSVERLKDFPELIKRKPIKTYNYAYWFNPFDKESRITMLKEAIEELERK